MYDERVVLRAALYRKYLRDCVRIRRVRRQSVDRRRGHSDKLACADSARCGVHPLVILSFQIINDRLHLYCPDTIFNRFYLFCLF